MHVTRKDYHTSLSERQYVAIVSGRVKVPPTTDEEVLRLFDACFIQGPPRVTVNEALEGLLERTCKLMDEMYDTETPYLRKDQPASIEGVADGTLYRDRKLRLDTA